MNFRIATVGQVDHGKSTLIGRLLADTGQARDDREAKVKSFCESAGHRFEFAFLLDALEEEQAQGITIDVTEVNWRFAGRNFTFVDTPGHREFLKKMVGGASRVDAAILMLDVTEGVQESLRRQARILDLLGIQDIIVLVNKMDLVSWSQQAWLRRKDEINSLLANHRGTIHILPVAAWHGANLITLASQMPWYQGPTLVQVLVELHRRVKPVEGPARFFIQDVYRYDDKRVFVGRVESGKIQVGDELSFFPGNLRTRVKSIEVFGESPHTAHTGQAIGLTFDNQLYLERGALGFAPASPPLFSKMAAADLIWLAPLPLKTGDRLLLKTGTSQYWARVLEVIKEVHADSFIEDQHSKQVGLFGRVCFEFDEPVALDRFEESPATGRFVASHAGQIVGGGRWIDSIDYTQHASQTEGVVFWFTGLSGSGKSTLANALKNELKNKGRNVVVLDGDELRTGLCRDLGYSANDRQENLRRAAEVAKLFADNGSIVITAFISPLQAYREMARTIIGADRFHEIFIDAPLAVCEQRDPKGLYAKARQGLIAEFTGISAPFEQPNKPALAIRTDKISITEAVKRCLDQFPYHAESKALRATHAYEPEAPHMPASSS